MRCGSGWGACNECGRRLLDGDETLLLPVALDGEPASNDRARPFSATINAKKTASWRPVSRGRVTKVNQVVTVDTEAESDTAPVEEGPLDALGSTYRRPHEKPDAVHRDPFAFDPNELDRATGRHRETQDLLEGLAMSHGLRTASPSSEKDEPDFDLLIELEAYYLLVEVKTLSGLNQSKQLRLGLGQVLDYADRLSGSAKPVRPVIAVDSVPEERWSGLCSRHGVTLVWPETFASVLG